MIFLIASVGAVLIVMLSLLRSRLKINVTPEFKAALRLMEGSARLVFITGKAGTGKSTLLRYFLSKTKQRCVVVCPTGIGALNVGGQTVHSFFGYPPVEFFRPEHSRRLDQKEAIFSNLDVLIIDEASMVRADMMDAIDRSLRLNRNADLPFGGVKMILFGDLYQLPPVLTGPQRPIFLKVYPDRYFFYAQAFGAIAPAGIELTKVFRQKSDKFVSVLNRIREDSASGEDFIFINSRVGASREDDRIVLTTTNEAAETINRMNLTKLPGPKHVFMAEVAGEFEESPADTKLELKKGARVLMVKNDMAGRWVNGSMGTVTDLGPRHIEVTIKGKPFEVSRETWDKSEYLYNPSKDRFDKIATASFTQYPMKLAWAMTIHKSQGQTFDAVEIEMGPRGAFEHGQTYVALSRCRTVEGITLRRPIRTADVIVNESVKKFTASLKNMSPIKSC